MSPRRFVGWLRRRWRRHLAVGVVLASVTFATIVLTYDDRAVGGTRPGTMMFVISRLGSVTALLGWLALTAAALGAALTLVAWLRDRRRAKRRRAVDD